MPTNIELRKQFLDLVDQESPAELGTFEVRANEGYNVGGGDTPYNSADKGKASVPLTIQSLILKAIDFNSPVVSLANVIRTEGTHRVVMDTSAPTKARLVKEGAAIGTVDSEFKPVELKAYKYAEIVKFTREVVEDVNFDVVGHASQRLATAFAKAFEGAIVAGTGAGQPQGLLQYTAGNDLQQAKETICEDATNYTVGLKDVITSYYKLPHEMRDGAVFLCHPDVVKELALLEDSEKRALIVPEYSGEFQTIMGKRIVESYNMDAPGTTGKKCAMWVNVGKAITAGMRTDVSVRQLNELYAANDMVALVGVMRFDSKLVYEGAISALKTA